MSMAIHVEGLSKRYRLGRRVKYKALRDSIAATASAPFRAGARLLRGESGRVPRDEYIWSLKDVDFQVRPGEVVAVIGRNGAGKSTLLKILSRITPPTRGMATLRGRIGSLLEVGTGFHPELTGRENVFLNGAILGMRRREIERRFDEIVGFAEVSQFIDTPVKHYSSGMYVRLAFAVAAHLEPEILLVDEVLAVGDMEFQKKCIGRMQAVGREGRTVLFVSHNMAAVTSLCDRGILLERGCVAAIGTAAEVASEYARRGISQLPEIRWDPALAPGNDVARMIHVRALDENELVPVSFEVTRPIDLEIAFEVMKPGIWFTPSVLVENEIGLLLFNSAAQIDPSWDKPLYGQTGRYVTRCRIPGNLLAEGTYSVSVTLWGFTRPPHKGVVVPESISFRIHDSLTGDSARGKTTGAYPGIIRPKLCWTTLAGPAVGAAHGRSSVPWAL